MILILGMPRSGTSFVCQILENFGFNFNINDENKLDNIYLPNIKYYQHKNLHFKIYETDAKFFKNVKINLELPNTEIIKEPYLLFFLESIKDKVKKIILVVRNPTENIESIKNFGKINNSNKQLAGYNEWNLYYINFLQIIRKVNIPFIIINYNNFKIDYNYEVNKLKNFLNIQIDNNSQNKINFKNNNNYDMINVPPLSKYIYLNLISNDTNKYDDTLKNYKNMSKIKPNDMCYCNSGKKYKKCCNLIC